MHMAQITKNIRLLPIRYNSPYSHLRIQDTPLDAFSEPNHSDWILPSIVSAGVEPVTECLNALLLIAQSCHNCVYGTIKE